MVIHTRDTDMILTRRGMALFSRKLRMYGPRYLWLISQL